VAFFAASAAGSVGATIRSTLRWTSSAASAGRRSFFPSERWTASIISSRERVEELPDFLRVAVSEQLHRTLQVGEQHGELLALALQGAAGDEDPLG
jgi:hypothetical protein